MKHGIVGTQYMKHSTPHYGSMYYLPLPQPRTLCVVIVGMAMTDPPSNGPA